MTTLQLCQIQIGVSNCFFFCAKPSPPKQILHLVSVYQNLTHISKTYVLLSFLSLETYYVGVQQSNAHVPVPHQEGAQWNNAVDDFLNRYAVRDVADQGLSDGQANVAGQVEPFLAVADVVQQVLRPRDPVLLRA